mmetsp:Transcript_4219/g.6269  ORF Transcript_4219/g.6269 Transcript_4219/m.6269 type:complete len:216 (+) Transcript_4219:13-660(+)
MEGKEDGSWKGILESKQIPRKVLNGIVMNYFIVNGYKEVAADFIQDSGIKPTVSLESIENRMEIRKLVFEGNIPKVIEKVNELNPKILDSRPKLLFMLQQQRLIELIRQGPSKFAESLTFARKELAPIAAANEKFLEELERVMALLAFPDPSKSAVGHLLGFEQRQKLVGALNNAILTSQCQSKDPRLLHLLRHLVYTQTQLKEHFGVKFPVMKV